MENNFDFANRENFRIHPEVWLHTLLAIVGDKEKKEEVVQRVAQQTGAAPEIVEIMLAMTINILINQTRSN